MVFFGQHNTTFLEHSRQVLDELAQLTRDGYSFIMVRGATDASETTPDDGNLAFRREEAVRDYLAGLGVDPHRIALYASGSLPPLVPTPPGVAEQQNRRAEVLPADLGAVKRYRQREACLDWLRQHCIPAGSVPAPACYAALDWLRWQ